MTPAHDHAVTAGADAELRGDAFEALRLHRSVPMFRQSTHGDRLQQLADLGASTPGWMVNRWLTIQARRRMCTGADATGTNRVLQLMVPLVHPDHIPFEAIGCEYPEQVLPYINDRDWVIRQADVFDLGALRRFVVDHASPELLERADHIMEWCEAPMRACRIEYVDQLRTDPLRVLDLTSGEELPLLDLGAQVRPGQHVLGRVVPISAAPGAMFDWRPLPVRKRVAREIAADPRLWMTRLHSAASNGLLAPAYSHLSEASLTSDLPYRSWLNLLGREPSNRGPDPAALIAEALRKAHGLARRGSDELFPLRHALGDLVLDPAFDEAMRWRFVSPEDLAVWQRLEEVVPESAKSRCRNLAMWCSAAPDHPDAIA